MWKDGSRFVTGPELNPTGLCQPLGADSAHAPHCHTSWPAARLTISRALSGNPSIFQKAKQELINRFISHFAPESVITNLERTDGLAAVRRGTERDGLWLVVAFHPVIYRTLRRAIANFSGLERDAGHCYEWACDAKCPRIRIAWKTTCQHTGPSSTRRASRCKTPNKLEELEELRGFVRSEIQEFTLFTSEIQSQIFHCASGWSDPCVERQFSKTARFVDVSSGWSDACVERQFSRTAHDDMLWVFKLV